MSVTDFSQVAKILCQAISHRWLRFDVCDRFPSDGRDLVSVKNSPQMAEISCLQQIPHRCLRCTKMTLIYCFARNLI